MRSATAVLAALAALCAGSAHAADAPRAHPSQVAPLVGAFRPTGHARRDLHDCVLAGVVVTHDVLPEVAVVGAVSWAPTRVARLGSRRLDLLQYDVGVQGQVALDAGYGIALQPFAGVGVGARTYRFRGGSVDPETDLTAYVSAGATFLYGDAAVSFTARDYVSTYAGLGVFGGTSARNDVSLFGSVGVRF